MANVVKKCKPRGPYVGNQDGVWKDGALVYYNPFGPAPKAAMESHAQWANIGYAAGCESAADVKVVEALTGLVNIATHPKATKAGIKMIAQECRALLARLPGNK
jgi:hypothetical protein